MLPDSEPQEPRSPPELQAAVVDLDVMNAPEFAKGRLLGDTTEAPAPWALWNGQQYGVIPFTRCNGYARLLLLRLGLRVPILTANRYFDWFASPEAINRGWRSIDLTAAVARANAGFPVVVVGQEAGHGHIAIGVPSPSRDPSTLYVTAAGATNTAQMRFVDQFGGLAPRCRLFTHD